MKYTESVTLPDLSAEQARRLIERSNRIPLYAHAYAFHLNFRCNRMGVEALLQFAHQHRLKGIKIHLDDGESLSLRHCDDARLVALKALAQQWGLEVHLEVSSTDTAELGEAVRIGRLLAATSIRCYPRYAGRVSEIIAWTVRDLTVLSTLDPQGQFRFTLEQHEDLKGEELVRIVEAVGNPNLKLLFDFANMLNACEHPLDALKQMAPHISDVHIKDAQVVSERGGWGHRACRSGEGQLPMARLLLELLLLGDEQPQVLAYGLEEEVAYYAPPLRFADEAPDPWIPYRGVSETELAANADLDALLVRELQDAQDQLDQVRGLLGQLQLHARHWL
ncbi:sugar phosphate isomerase/epimerase family protein [Marinobacterium sedimentorum]|uniref:sugar phosphate isomerase/epimerase family protein n=1 Tax=Marinobacterium sedimentorum TaxID=2927804 RepID=UPI0020C5CC6C|nr:TIM barrel protein [Marinobacterium sedimentorum]MCP8687513.1 sugar phosphate isomerase/epimerase [Marinobacterium sedimentorum]